jgi:hypothetical protein
MTFGKSPPYFFCLVLFIMLARNGLLAGSSFAAEQAEISCGAPRQSNSPGFQQWRFKNTCSRKVTLHYLYKDSFGQKMGVTWAEPCKDGQILQVRLDAQIEWTRVEVEADGGGCDIRSTGALLNPTAAQSSKASDEIAQLKKSAEAATATLQEERKKTAALTDDLATARRDFETKPAPSGKVDDEAAQLKKSVEGVTAEPEQERQKNAALVRGLDSAQLAIDAPTAPDRIAKSQVVQAKPIAAPVAEQPPTSARKVDLEEARLIVRAIKLLRQGNIGSARIVLERAVEMGSAEASFAIAETYDTGVLSHWNAYGTRGDVAKARQFYAKAAAGGIEEASDRLASLHD